VAGAWPQIAGYFPRAGCLSPKPSYGSGIQPWALDRNPDSRRTGFPSGDRLATVRDTPSRPVTRSGASCAAPAERSRRTVACEHRGRADRACRGPSSLNDTATSRCSDVRCRRPGQGGALPGTSGETGADYVALPGDVPPTFPWFALRLGRRPVGTSARSAPVRRFCRTNRIG
jgi:hypothetical protein